MMLYFFLFLGSCRLAYGQGSRDAMVRRQQYFEDHISTWEQVAKNNIGCGNDKLFNSDLNYAVGVSRLKARKTIWQYNNCSLAFSNSQNNEDMKMYRRFFSDKKYLKNGFFVEIGGSNGVSFSNSLFYEYCLGWKGILIEGNPFNFEALIHQRPCTTNYWSCVCGPDSPPYTTMHFEKGNSRIYPYQLRSKSMFKSETSIVPCRTLSSIFSEYVHPPGSKFEGIRGVTWIDFFSVDVERAEALVLSTIDWNVTQVGVMIVENVAAALIQGVDEIVVGKAGMIKLCVTGKEGCIPDCQLKKKRIPSVRSSYLYMSDLYVHPTLRDDICDNIS